jgi:hypothetical protein
MINKELLMKVTMSNLAKITAAALLVFTIAACDDGGAENAGEKIDEVVTDAGNAIEDACEDVKENADAKDKDC